MTTTSGHRDGATYATPRDTARLNRQAQAVYDVMADHAWRTLGQIADATGEPEASISARLRDLRKPRFGGHIVEREYLADGVWRYRVLPAVPVEPYQMDFDAILDAAE